MPTALRFTRWRGLLLAALAGVTVATGSPETLLAPIASAHAQSSARAGEPTQRGGDKRARKRAREHFRRGQRMFAMGRFRDALESYESAHTLSEHPDILFNIAQCYRNMGDYESAIFHFRDYLKQKPDAENRTAVLELVAKLEAELERADRKERRDEKVLRPPRKQEKTQTPPPPDRRDDQETSRPLYKRWWFWAGLAAIAGGGGAVYYLSTQGNGIPETGLGNIDFAR